MGDAEYDDPDVYLEFFATVLPEQSLLFGSSLLPLYLVPLLLELCKLLIVALVLPDSFV
jgi:hypothetical protein